MIINYITNTRSGIKIGERNQALGVVDALRAHDAEAIQLEYDVSEVERLHVNLKRFSNRLNVIVGVSDSGIKIFTQLPMMKNCINVLIGHEVPEQIKTVAEKLDILAIPGYVKNCPAKLDGVRIVRTEGVANTMTGRKAHDALRDWMDKFPADKKHTVIVAMLGGSVDGRDFQPQEAESMARYVAQYAKKNGAYILATDSPRTSPRDTEHFTDILASSGCPSAFFPFSMKNQNNETPYRAMVGMAALNPKNRIVITADSVSMPCEIAHVVPPGQIYLYPVSNLNQQNADFVEWMYQSGRAGQINPGDFTEHHKPVIEDGRKMDAAGQIAAAILSIV